MKKWFIVLLLPIMALAQYSSKSYDNRNATSSGWGDISQAPFKIRGQNDSTYLSFNPLDFEDATYPIGLRIGIRGQQTGDSRSWLYVSDSLNNAGATESQMIYGVGLYYGDATATQMGVHGISQARNAAGDTLASIAGMQAFGQMIGTGRVTNMFGGSFNVQGVNTSDGSVGSMIGVRANVYIDGKDTVSEANCFRGIAPTTSDTGAITWARTAYFQQPSSGTSQNYALMLADPTTAAGADNVTMAFSDSGGNNTEFSYIQRNGVFKIGDDLVLPNKLTIGADTIPTTSHILVQKASLSQIELRGTGNGADARLLMLTGDSTGGQANAVIYFSRSSATAPYDWGLLRRYSSANNDFEILNGNNVMFELWPDSAYFAKKVYKGAITADSQFVTSGSVGGAYETITNVAKIGDDTTNFKLAKDSVDAWDNGVLAPSANPNFTGTLTADSGQFDGNVDIDSMDVNGVADFAGQLVMGDAAGTSFKLPTGTNPTVNAEGEVAQETDDEALRVYDGAANRAIPTVYRFDALIMLPDSINAYDSPIPVLTVDTLWAPFGIKILNLTMATDAATTDTIAFWEYVSPTDGSPSLIDTLILSTASEVKETTITDSDIGANTYIYLDLSSGTALDWIKVAGAYYIKTGD